MLNEVLLAGELIDEPEAGRTETGYTTARARLRVSEAKADGSRWYTNVPLSAFAKAADDMVVLGKGAVVLVRGRLRFLKAEGLFVAVRTVEAFAAPVVPAMYATPTGDDDSHPDGLSGF